MFPPFSFFAVDDFYEVKKFICTSHLHYICSLFYYFFPTNASSHKSLSNFRILKTQNKLNN